MEEGLCIREGIVGSYTGREESVAVPEGIHTIGEGAFKGCVSLKKVILPSSLRSIGPEAFKGCRRLQSVEIPAGVSYVGDYAFHRCHSLERVSLPPSVAELGDCVFLYCDSLREAGIPGVRRLGRQAFLNDVCLGSITISRELSEECIYDVFTGCGKITRIAFADGECFSFPTAVEVFLGEIKAPSLVRAIAADILRMVELDGRCLVRFLTNLKHVEVPEGIRRIGKSCFFDKRGIISVSLPASLEEIGSRAFRNCISLEKIIFGNGQAGIHEDAFKNCSSLRYIETCDGRTWELAGLAVGGEGTAPGLVRAVHGQVLGNFRISGTILLKYLGEELRVVVPDGITVIAERAFAGNEAIDRVILPESVREIGREAFKGCVLLQTIGLVEGILRIGEGAFENCVKLIRAVLPQGLVRIGKRVFKRCQALREAVFGTALAEIGEQAFYGCAALKGVEFPEGVASIGKMAFFRCGGLREVVLPENIAEVGSLAFAQSGVKKVSVLARGSGFGSDVFAGCTRLRVLVFGKRVCHISDRFAYGCSALCQVELPDAVESVGKNVLEKTPYLEGWKQEAQKGTGQAGAVFWDGSFLEGKVCLPESVKVLAGGAFYGNGKITEVYLPSGIRWVGAAAFKGCGALRFVKLPDGIRDLEPEVFSGCAKLELAGADVPWESVGERAFYGCGSLREVCLRHAHWIGKEAFAGCISLGKSAVEGIGGGRVWEFAGNLMQNVEISQAGDVWQEQAQGLGKCPERDGECGTGEHGWKGTAKRWEGSLASGDGAYSGRNTGLAGVRIGERAFEGTSVPEKSPDGQFIVGSIVVSGQLCEGEIHIQEGITAIAPFAFAANRKIKKVMFPESLSEIGEGAFWGCDNLLEVVFPESIRTIGARAFGKCSSIVKISSSAKQVGAGAFSWCEALEYAELPGIRVLEAYVFEGCGNLEVCICKKAEEIKERCFSGCGKLKICVCEDTEKIEKRNFSGCEEMEISACEDTEEKEKRNFSGCEEMEISACEDMEEKEKRNFSSCEEMKICVCEDAEEKEKRNFSSCEEMEISGREETGEKEKQYFSGCEEREICACEETGEKEKRNFSGCEKREIYACGDAEGMKKQYFGGSRESEGFLLRNVRRVGCYAFDRCDSLRKVTFQDGVFLEPHGFEDCGCLEEITLDGEAGEVCLREYAFSGCTALRSVRRQGKEYCFRVYQDIRSESLPELVRLLFHSTMSCFVVEKEENLCAYLGKGRTVKIPEGIRRIEAEAFRDVLMLTEIDIPESVEYIGPRAFHGTNWLSGRRGESALVTVNRMLLDGSCAEGEVTVGKDVRLVCGWAFANGMKIRKIRFLSEKVRVEEYAFRNCIYLEEIELPDGTCIRMGGISDRGRELPALAKQAALERLNCFKTDGQGVLLECTGNLYHILLPDGITAIGEGAFQNSNLLTDITFPETVKEIRKGAFMGCKWLKEIRSASGVEKIGEMAFSGCGALEKVELSGRLRSLGARAFEHCTELKDILLPEGVEEIPARAFYRCRSLKQVALPFSARKIGEEAFAFCRGMEEIRMPGDAEVMERVFAGCGLISRKL